MIINDFLVNDIPAVETLKDIKNSLKTAKDLKISHLPVVKDGRFIGNIRVDFLKNKPSLEDTYKFIERFAISIKSPIIDSLKLFDVFDTTFLPIIDEHDNYLGYLTHENIINRISKYSFFSDTGVMMILEIPIRKYSLSQIAQIVESHNAKFYGVMVIDYINDNIQIAIKISGEHITSVAESFERYGYEIIHKFYEDRKTELLDDRYSHLMNYLNI